MSLRFALFSRYKLLNKALLANWLASLDNACLRRAFSLQTPFFLLLSKFSFKPLCLSHFLFLSYSRSLSLLLFLSSSGTTNYEFGGSHCIDCMSSTSLLWYQFPPGIPITRLPPSYNKRKIEYNDCHCEDWEYWIQERKKVVAIESLLLWSFLKRYMLNFYLSRFVNKQKMVKIISSSISVIVKFVQFLPVAKVRGIMT